MEQDQEKLPKDPFKSCYNCALYYLARRDYSRAKLKKKLNERGHEREIAERVLDLLTEQNYLREDLYIEARIKGFVRKGHSFYAIGQKLAAEGCAAKLEEIQQVAEQMGQDEDNVLWDLIEKKVRIDYDFVSNKQKLRERTLRYVISRGHSISKASQFYEKIIQEFEEDNLS
ncbi:MAG: regulatory protein RecX [Deltaproteobacteria bacterium]|nr:MAG: regulatory protein RecX [Deltaproteobacteria bacterium]